MMIRLMFLLILFFASNLYAQDSVMINSTRMEIITTTGIFEGKIVTVGNFNRMEVYKINEYCIAPEDIAPELLDALKGKKVTVTGTLKIIEGHRMPAKTSNEGRVYEPYKEPDKKFIVAPMFKIEEF